MPVVSGGGYGKIDRLTPCGSGSHGEYVPQFAVRLGVQLVEDYAVGVESVFGVGVCRQDAIEAAIVVENALGRIYDLAALGEGGRIPHHVGGDVEHD